MAKGAILNGRSRHPELDPPVAAMPPGRTPSERVETDILAALTFGCPINDVREIYFSDWARKHAFRLIRDFTVESGRAPGGALLHVLAERYEVPEILRTRFHEVIAEIVDEVASPFEPRGAKYFDVHLRELKKRHREWATRRFCDDIQRRLDAGDDIAELGPLRIQDAWEDDQREPASLGAEPFADMLKSFKSLREPIIHGIGRRGETANIVSGTKIGKTWLLHFLALCLANGRDWLGHRVDRPRNVLLLDNELHRDTLIWRLRSVAEAMGLQPSDYQDRLRVESLRGKGVNVTHLSQIADRNRSWKPDFVGIDSWYRFLPPGSNENDNSGMKDVAEQIIGFADDLDALVAIVHHSTKGDQSERSVTDVGSGAGSISRAADTHVVLRPHQEEGCAVMEARVRSFEQPEPQVLRWNCPLWSVEGDLSPKDLRNPRRAAQESKDSAEARELADVVGRILKSDRQATATAIRKGTDWRLEKVKRLLKVAQNAGLIRKCVESDAVHFVLSGPVLEVPNDF